MIVEDSCMKAYRDVLTIGEDSGPAVIVDFGERWRLLFWTKRWGGASQWDLGDVWVTNEWLETNSIEDRRWFEPMMDREARYSRVDILEGGDARAVVRWHYACCNPEYKIFNGNTFADEYYTVYPDGIAVRKLVAWPGNESDFGGNSNFWETGEFILSLPKADLSRKEMEKWLEENLETERVFTFHNLEGEEISYSWPMPSPRRALCSEHPEIADWDAYVLTLHLKNRPDPFVVVPHNKALFPYRPSEWPPLFMHSPDCRKDHPQFLLWDGKTNLFCSYGFCYTPFERPPRPTVLLMLTGATEDSSSAHMAKLASSWLNPAHIRIEDFGRRNDAALKKRWGNPANILYIGFKYSERAYTFNGEMAGKRLKFTMIPSLPYAKKPVQQMFREMISQGLTFKEISERVTEKFGRVEVVNPIFKIENWCSNTVNVKVNGESLNPDEYKWQTSQGNLIIWMNMNIKEDTTFEITPQ